MANARHLSRVLVASVLLLAVLAAPLAGVAPAAVSPLAPAANDFRISQVYGGGGNSGATYTHDFIEILNAGSSTVSLSGWSVQYESSTGTSWQVTSLGGSIGPGQYYLIQEAQGSGGTTALPTPDASGSIAMSATSGKVALVSSTTALSGSCPTGGALVDFAGYGTANCYEGSGAAPGLSNTTAALRANDGCTDSDNSSADFASFAAHGRAEAWQRIEQASYFRAGWADAYGHFLVATGRVEAMFDPVMNARDCGPFPPILQEAGGYFGDWQGNPTIHAYEALSTSQALPPDSRPHPRITEVASRSR